MAWGAPPLLLLPPDGPQSSPPAAKRPRDSPGVSGSSDPSPAADSDEEAEATAPDLDLDLGLGQSCPRPSNGRAQRQKLEGPITQNEAHRYFSDPSATVLGSGANGSTVLVELKPSRSAPGGPRTKAVVKLHNGRNSWMPEMIRGVNQMMSTPDDQVETDDSAWTSAVFARREAFYHLLAWKRIVQRDAGLARQLTVPACMDFAHATNPIVYHVAVTGPYCEQTVQGVRTRIRQPGDGGKGSKLQQALKKVTTEKGKPNDILLLRTYEPTIVKGSAGVVCVTFDATFWSVSERTYVSESTEEQHELMRTAIARAAAEQRDTLRPVKDVYRPYYTVQGLAEPTEEEAAAGFGPNTHSLHAFIKDLVNGNSRPLSRRGAWTIATAYGRLCGSMNRHGIFHGDLHAGNIIVFPRKADHADFPDDPIRWRVIDWGMGQEHAPLFDEDGAARSCEYENAFKRLGDASFAAAQSARNKDAWSETKTGHVDDGGTRTPSIKHPPGVRVRPRDAPGYDGAPHGDKYDFHIQPPGPGEDAYCRGERQDAYRLLGIALPLIVPLDADNNPTVSAVEVTGWIWAAYEKAIGREQDRPRTAWPTAEEARALFALASRADADREMANMFEAALPSYSGVEMSAAKVLPWDSALLYTWDAMEDMFASDALDGSSSWLRRLG